MSKSNLVQPGFEPGSSHQETDVLPNLAILTHEIFLENYDS